MSSVRGALRLVRRVASCNQSSPLRCSDRSGENIYISVSAGEQMRCRMKNVSKFETCPKYEKCCKHVVGLRRPAITDAGLHRDKGRSSVQLLGRKPGKGDGSNLAQKT
jgi:hypothetical protein